LEHFCVDIPPEYDRRDEPAREATSQLSPHLRFGEISPLKVWHRVHATIDPAPARTPPSS
jgi:deoxyribodipyrimidine photo-lyase